MSAGSESTLFVRALMILLSFGVAACSERPTAPDRGSPESLQISGNANVEVTGYDERGRRITAPGAATMEMSLADGPVSATSTKYQPHIRMSTTTSAPTSTEWRGLPSFGAPVEQSKRNGKDAKTFTIHTQRVASVQNEGKLIEVLVVRRGGSKVGKPVGLLTRIDGKIRQYHEFEFDGDSKKPRSVRSVHVDEEMRVRGEMDVDLKGMRFGNGEVAANDQWGLGKQCSSLLRGLGDLILPKKLHAQFVGPTHPCNGTEQVWVASGIAAATAAGVASAKIIACTNALWWMCPTAVEAAWLASGLAATFLYMTAEF